MNFLDSEYDRILAVLVVAIAHCIILIHFINARVRAFDTENGKFSVLWFLLVLFGYIVSFMFYITLVQIIYYNVPYSVLLLLGMLFIALFFYLVYLITFKCKFSFSVKIDKKD